MEQKKYFFAVDLGATSGRTIVGSLSDGKFDLEELTPFRQQPDRNRRSLLLGYLRPLL